MIEVVVFGGTSEGREIATWLDGRGSAHVTYVCATAYGTEQVAGLTRVTALAGPLEPACKRALVERATLVVDATHPYATHITQSVGALCAELAVPCVRIVRDEGPDGAWTSAADVEAAAAQVATSEGNVLLTTGTSGLQTFVEQVGANRLFCRILPRAASIEAALTAGIAPDHLICMQGVASTRLTRALIAEVGARVLVTKRSGERGGFPEKVEAARLEGAELVVIERPTAEVGLTLEEAARVLEVTYGL